MEEYKGYLIVSDNFNMKVIKPIGKGSVPKELRGSFTHTSLARRAIDVYQPPTKVNKSDKTE